MKIKKNKKARVVLLVATLDELNALKSFLPKDKKTAIGLIGIGKVNAAMATMKALVAYPKATLFVNVGTCGAVLPDVKGVLPVGSAVQSDFDLRPLGYNKGQVPTVPGNRLGGTGVRCATADKFVSNRIDICNCKYFGAHICDMELAAIEQVIKAQADKSIKLRAIKIVSDSCDATEYTSSTEESSHIMVRNKDKIIKLLEEFKHEQT